MNYIITLITKNSKSLRSKIIIALQTFDSSWLLIAFTTFFKNFLEKYKELKCFKPRF